ncbi:MAG TPA: NHL repeat-containing protein [Solirubrobacterales bacterium]|jgi:DNA-binding beta-propeller fold protein YncE|nr:NHL repeat-containing protein [Solirubrobacterales bacterium]
MPKRAPFLLLVLAALVAAPAALAIPEPLGYPGFEAHHLSSFGSTGSGAGQFEHPAGVGVAPDGHVWVVDEQNNRIQEFGSGGEYLGQIGSKGSGAGDFFRPTALAFGPEGRFWVLDANNRRLQQFDEAGNFIRAVHPGGEHALANPEGISVDSAGNVWVSDTGHSRVEEFSEAGEFLAVVGGGGELAKPTGSAIDPQGRLWVADWSNERVAVFDAAGNLVRYVGDRVYPEARDRWHLVHPDAVAIDSAGTVLVVDGNMDHVSEYNLEGEYITQFGYYWNGPYEFVAPEGIAFDNSGDAWITDAGHNRVDQWSVPRIDYTATYKGSFTGKGEAKLQQPTDLAIGLDGKVWVSDRGADRVEIFGPEGKFVAQFGSKGSGPGQFLDPTAITIDAHGNVYVLDAGNHRVEKFNWKHEFKFAFGFAEGSPLRGEPWSLATDAKGAVYVSDEHHVIKKFSGTGEFVRRLWKYKYPELFRLDFDSAGNIWGLMTGPSVLKFSSNGVRMDEVGRQGWPGYGVGEFKGAEGLDVDSNDYVFISSVGSGRVQVFNDAGEFVTWFGAPGLGRGQFSPSKVPYWEAASMSVESSGEGDVYVIDPGFSRITHWQVPSGL